MGDQSVSHIRLSEIMRIRAESNASSFKGRIQRDTLSYKTPEKRLFELCS